MNAVGIDVSKGRSIVCVMRPFGEVVLEPFKVLHTAQNLHDLAEKLKALDRDPRCSGSHRELPQTGCFRFTRCGLICFRSQPCSNSRLTTAIQSASNLFFKVILSHFLLFLHKM